MPSERREPYSARKWRAERPHTCRAAGQNRAEGFADADYLEGVTVHANVLPQRLRSRKQLLGYIGADKAHSPARVVFTFVEVTPSTGVDSFDVGNVCGGGADTHA